MIWRAPKKSLSFLKAAKGAPSVQTNQFVLSMHLLFMFFRLQIDIWKLHLAKPKECNNWEVSWSYNMLAFRIKLRL